MNSTQAAQAYDVAERRFSEHKFEEALQLLDSLATSIPLHEAVEFARAQTLVMLGRADEADAICDKLVALFGAEGVAELKQVLRELQRAGDEEVQWGFARPTEDPLSFDDLDIEETAPTTSAMGDDIDSFFAELGDAAIEDADAIALPGPEPEADTPRDEVLDEPAAEHEPPALAEPESLAQVEPEPPAPAEPEPPEQEVQEHPESAELEPLAQEVPEPPEPTELEPLAQAEPELPAQEVPESLVPDVPEAPIPAESLAPLEPLDEAAIDKSPGVLAEFTPASETADDDSGAGNALGALQDEPPAFPSDVDDLGPLSSLEDDVPAVQVPRPIKNELGALGELGELDDGPEALSSGEFFLVDSSGGSLTDSEQEPLEPEPRMPAPAPPSLVHAFEDDDEPLHGDTPTWPAAAPPPMPPPAAFEEAAAALPQFSVFDEEAPPPPPPVAEPSRRSGSRRVVLLLLLLLTVGGGGLWFYMQPKPGSRSEAPPVPPGSASTPVEGIAPLPAPVFDEAEFTKLLAELTPEADPSRLLAGLRTVQDISQWPSAEQPALWRVVEASGRTGGGAAATSYIELAQALLKQGAPADFMGPGGVTLADLAAQANDEPMVALLLENGAKASSGMMVWAARSGRLPLVQRVLQAQPDSANAEALYGSIDARQDAVTGLLLQRDIDMQQVLVLAVQRGARHVFRFAVEHGANVRDSAGLLHTAIASQQPAMVELLLEAGVDPQAPNEKGETPLQMLEAKIKTAADLEILRLLREQTSVQVAAVSPAPQPDASSSQQAEVLGELYSRGRQQEDWVSAGAWRGPLERSADKVFRIDVNAQSDHVMTSLAKLGPGDLHTLRLTGPGVTDASLKSIADLSGLRELDIFGAAITDVGLQQLKSLTLLTSLRVASPAGGPRTQINGPGLTILRPMLHLIHLDFSGTTFGDRAMPLLESLTGLKSLNLSGTEVTEISLGTLRQLRNLEILAFGSGPGLAGKVTGSALYAVRDIETLRELHLYGVTLSATAFDVLEGLRRLSYLDLRKTGLTDADVPELVRLKHVGVILLGENDLGQEARQKLTEQINATRLEF